MRLPSLLTNIERELVRLLRRGRAIQPTPPQSKTLTLFAPAAAGATPHPTAMT
jgi:hypothetical protein